MKSRKNGKIESIARTAMYSISALRVQMERGLADLDLGAMARMVLFEMR